MFTVSKDLQSQRWAYQSVSLWLGNACQTHPLSSKQKMVHGCRQAAKGGEILFQSRLQLRQQLHVKWPTRVPPVLHVHIQVLGDVLLPEGYRRSNPLFSSSLDHRATAKYLLSSLSWLFLARKGFTIVRFGMKMIWKCVRRGNVYVQ